MMTSPVEDRYLFIGSLGENLPGGTSSHPDDITNLLRMGRFQFSSNPFLTFMKSLSLMDLHTVLCLY